MRNGAHSKRYIQIDLNRKRIIFKNNNNNNIGTVIGDSFEGLLLG